MKAVSLALLLFFALFALSTKLEPTRADYVYDTKGNPLLSGASYYASYYHPGGGLVKPAQIDDETKPISVVLGPILENQKWPVKFIVHGDETTVTTDSSLDIEFTTAPSGVSSTRWSVGKDYLVRIDSQDQALKGTFKIAKLSNNTGRYAVRYQIVFHEQGGLSRPLWKKQVSGYDQLLAALGAQILPFVFYTVDWASSGISAI